jgi:hypothetical protein
MKASNYFDLIRLITRASARDFSRDRATSSSLARNANIAPSAERVLEQCIALKRAVDVDEILIIPHYGDIEIWKALRTQELFAREVIPKLRAM